jgi:hypothetical protein
MASRRRILTVWRTATKRSADVSRHAPDNARIHGEPHRVARERSCPVGLGHRLA